MNAGPVSRVSVSRVNALEPKNSTSEQNVGAPLVDWWETPYKGRAFYRTRPAAAFRRESWDETATTGECYALAR